MILEVTGLPVRAPDGRILVENAALRLPAGQAVAVQGRSGSGKSTLLGVLSGLLPADAGSVRLAGLELVGLSRHKRAAYRLRKVGFVYQGGHLLPELNALENVALPLRLAGASRRAATKSAMQSLEELDLGQVACQHPSALSGGEAQRVAVARALVHDPVFVVADEPTGSLDDESSARVVELLRFAAGRGAAVLVVTHDSRVAAAFGTRLLLQDRVLSVAARPEATS